MFRSTLFLEIHCAAVFCQNYNNTALATTTTITILIIIIISAPSDEPRETYFLQRLSVLIHRFNPTSSYISLSVSTMKTRTYIRFCSLTYHNRSQKHTSKLHQMFGIMLPVAWLDPHLTAIRYYVNRYGMYFRFCG